MSMRTALMEMAQNRLNEEKKYEIKNGKVHISRDNFKKVHKDYKNTTKGKERMMALDPKSGATTSFPVVFKEERAAWVPKSVLDEDVPAFMGAAAAAKKAGQDEFEFGGKKYKVTMKDKTADAIMKEALDAKDTDTVKAVVKALKGASKAHAGQAKQLKKDLEDSAHTEMDPKKHVKYNDEMKMYCVYNKDGKVVAKFEDEEDANQYAMKNHDALMGKEEMDEAVAAGSTAQHGPDDATSDSYEKQLATRGGEKDFADKHTTEVAYDAEELYKENQKEATAALKRTPGRLGDQRKGDTSFVNPLKAEIIDGITAALAKMKTNS